MGDGKVGKSLRERKTIRENGWHFSNVCATFKDKTNCIRMSRGKIAD